MADTLQPPEESNVCVAVKIRPLVQSEVEDGCRDSLSVTPGCPQVSSGQHTFTYDHVFGDGGSAPEQLYRRCIAPLVDALFKGYNATVFAYGQTGSGKTFTMGSEYRPGARCRGVIPDTINDIFLRIDAAKDRAVTVRVSFVEIHKEEVKDLLVPASTGPRPAVTIRETPNGDVALYGAVEKEVRSREEMAELLELGTLCRSTASTSMNNRSSRSHAIFTITMEQRRQVQQAAVQGEQGTYEDDDDETPGEETEGVEDFLGAKMHLVDLAGSERAKRTKAEGARLREGIHINRGLLALGNVINAIVDNHKHVPYRDSKLTRLLQDSLGGNSRTVMIACVSPADSNFEESLNTLRYADRARHIRNKPVVNRDPVAAQLGNLRTTIAQLKSENVSLRRALAAAGYDDAADAAGASGLGSSALEGLVDRLTQENSSLESDNMRLKLDMDELRQELAAVADKWHTAQAQCDLLRMNQVAAAAGLQNRRDSAGGADRSELPLPGLDIVKGYVARIADLEAEVMSMKSFAAHLPLSRRRPTGLEPPRTPGGSSTPGDLDSASPDPSSRLDGAHALGRAGDDGDAEDDPAMVAEEEYATYMAEVAAHTLNQEKMKKEVVLLQRQLDAKEKKMVELMKNTGAMPALKQHYDRVLADLESQRDTLVGERKALIEKLAAASAASEEERKRLEATYSDRIRQYDERLKELRRKERDYIAMQKLKLRTEDAHRRLSADILRLKQQKVAIQKQLESNAKQFASWRQDRERELGQLRKQSRKDRAQIQHLQAMAAKQSAVLQRKISDATAARKRIKELEEEKRRKTAGSSSAASQQQAAAALAAQQAMGGNVEIQPNAQAPMLRTDKDRREWMQRELEICNMACEFRKVIDGELAQRAEATRKLKDLEKRLTVLDQMQPASPLFLAGLGNPVLPFSPSAAGALGLPAAIGPETREKLLAKKKELEDKVAYHNDQITELQQHWERQKSEEESRGGGALDIRRWAGLRNVAECRELLRTLFRMSVESKTLSNELTVDMVRYMEEVDVLRVQLDGAQKKSAQYRKLAMALQAAAARVVSAPHHNSVSTQDETDKQVDAVLEALHVVRSNTPPAESGRPASTTSEPAGGETGTPTGAPGLGVAASGGQADDVEMQDAGSPDTPSTSKNGPAKALEFLSPVPSGARRRLSSFDTLSGAARRYSPENDRDSDGGGDDHVQGDSKGGPETRGAGGERFNNVGSPDGHCDMEMDVEIDTEPIPNCSSDSSGEGSDDDDDDDNKDESSEDSDEDDVWDPANATPAVRLRSARVSRRFSAAVGTGGAGGGSRRSSRRQPGADDGASSSSSSASDHFKPTPPSTEARSCRRRNVGGPRRTVSSRNSSSPDNAALEGPVLDDINLKRFTAGTQTTRLQKLTVAVLKEALNGQMINGQKWTASNNRRSKTRAELIQDYRRMLGLDKLSYLDSEAKEADAGDRVGEAGGATLAGRNRMGFGGAEPVGLSQADAPAKEAAEEDEGFTFSPHLPAAPILVASGPPVVPPIALGIRSTSPCQPTSSRLHTTGSPIGPWARSSLVKIQSARQPTAWASTLRSSCSLPTSDTGTEVPPGAPVLVRSNSVTRVGMGAASEAAAAADIGGGAGAASSRRPTAWGLPAAGQGFAGSGSQREALSYRAVLTSPQQSPSPRLPRPPMLMGAGGASPRSSLGSPTPRSVSRSGGRAGSGRMNALGMSPDPRNRSFGYHGGENMQPDMSTPRGTMDSASGEGKGTPLTNLYKEKAAAARERTAALRVSMHKNWEQQDPQQPQSGSGGMGSANMRSSMNGPVGTTGTVASSIDGPLRGGAGLRDSTGAGLGASKNQKAIWR